MNNNSNSNGNNTNGGEGSWGSDNACEVRVLKKDMEKESYGFQGGGGNEGLVMLQGGNELSGYGSEPGYRGDGELGDGDEFDEEEEDGKSMFWGDRFGGGGGIYFFFVSFGFSFFSVFC